MKFRINSTDRIQGLVGPTKDAIAILVVAAGVGSFSGAQKFTGFYTPDSEFYMTLGAFGDAVTDRAPTPAYYWTRLGQLLPLRALRHFTDFVTAWSIYRFLLILLIVSSVYLLVRTKGVSRVASALISCLVATNSVILYFVGDTYNTGTVVAWLLVLCTAWLRIDPHSDRYRSWTVVIGFVVGILLMANPTGLLVAVVLSSALLITRSLDGHWRVKQIFGLLPGALLGFLASLGCFLFAAQSMFPKLNWYQTVRFYATIIQPSDYSSPGTWVWLQHKYALLVPASAVLVTSIFLAAQFRNWRRLLIPVAVAVVTPAFFLWTYLRDRAVVFEMAFYSAMLWPGALISLVVCLCDATSSTNRTKSGETVVLLISVAVSIWFGHRVIGITGLVVFVVLCAAAIIVSILSGRRTCLILLALFFPLFQIIQNSSPNDPYRNVFTDTSSTELVQQNLAAEAWLLSNSTPSDRILVWVGNTTIEAAAMQLWGPNAVGTGTTAGAWERTNFTVVRPTIIATYFRPAPGYRVQRQEFLRALLDGLASEVSASCQRFSPARGKRLELCLHRISFLSVG